MRIGHGLDVHPFAEDDRPLWLGGVRITGAPGLRGHSDGDVLLHAVTDALLGAVGLGDIGELVGVGQPDTADAPSSGFVRRAVARVRAAGWSVGNIDCTIVAQLPRVAPHRQAIRESVARLLTVEAERVSVKATTTDGLGFIGQAQGIACAVVVLLERAGQ